MLPEGLTHYKLSLDFSTSYNIGLFTLNQIRNYDQTKTTGETFNQ